MVKLLLRLLSVWFVVAFASGCSDEQSIRTEILRRTPLGSTMEQVNAYCAAAQLSCHSSNTAGYVNRSTGVVVGSKSVWGIVENHKIGPLLISTSAAYWGFDSNGKLLDVWVWTTMEGP